MNAATIMSFKNEFYEDNFRSLYILGRIHQDNGQFYEQIATPNNLHQNKFKMYKQL